MPTSHTLVTVANRALDFISEFPISTLADESPYARWINRNFSHTVEMSLRQQPWNFACEMHTLNPVPGHPEYRWRYRYELPPGWLRVLPPTYNGQRNGRPLTYEVKRRGLYMNEKGPRPVELVMNVQEPGQWEPLFAELVAARLALGMSHRFTGKTSYTDRCAQLAQDALDAAAEINAFEGSVDPFEQHDIIRVRGGDYWGNEL